MQLPTLFLASLKLVLSLVYCSCNTKSTAPDSETPAGSNEIEIKINHYEKLTNEYARLAKKLKKGDVSITVRYIELEGRTRRERARLQEELAKMIPQQAQRLASISARVVP